jgi:CBS domain-containing protein
MTATTTTPTAGLLTSATIGEVMRPGVVTCPPRATVSAMAAAMVAHGIHAVVVTTIPGHAPLAVTDLELLAGALRADAPNAADLARELIFTISMQEPIARAVDIMSTRSVSHLLVVDPDSGDPAGVVSTLDIAAAAAGIRPSLVRMPRPGPARPSLSVSDLTRASVADVMHSGIAACDPTFAISTVARLMADQRTHCAAVSGIDAAAGREHRLIWGLIDDLDLLGAIHRGQLDWPASTIVDTTPMAVRESESLARAAELMVTHERRHLVAVGRAGLPSGMLSTLDIARVLANG